MFPQVQVRLSELERDQGEDEAFRRKEDEALAKEMMEEQVTNKWPGLVEEVNEMCVSMRIEDPKTTEVGKRAYSKMVKEACRWKDEALMKEEMERMKDKKMRTMVSQNLDLKEYVKNGTLFSARRTQQV